MRYEIESQEKVDSVYRLTLLQDMLRQGIIASEYVGHRGNDGKTPVTMQMMISKDAFEQLKAATSKNPIKPFQVEENSSDAKPAIPNKIQKFISSYLYARMKQCNSRAAPTQATVIEETVSISVNEAPATRANEVYHIHPISSDKCVFITLAGDAALGLSYFKGLNAGLISTARFLRDLTPAIKNKFVCSKTVKKGLARYQHWFQTDFAPKKIKEVANYSTYQIRSAMRLSQIARSIKSSSMWEPDADLVDLFRAYYMHVGNNPFLKNRQEEWHLYPHRPYELIKFRQFSHIPAHYTLIKIKKLFVDYFKPYKSRTQFVEDFKQPLVGAVNLVIGLGKIVAGIITINPKRFGDGLLRTLRGLIELASFPLAWTVKPLLRLCISGGYRFFKGPYYIENAPGMQKLAKFGAYKLQQYQSENKINFSPEDTYNSFAICHDLHRKFLKNLEKGQCSKYPLDNEVNSFKKILNDPSPVNMQKYYSLFYNSPSKVIDNENTQPINHINNPVIS